MSTNRDHVFISYAIEDVALSDWLARRLAALGYAVWYDRLKLLGGEPWPQDLDVAIKTRTHRMLGLLSRASAHKPNPTREWTTALNIARSENIPDLLIPLNVDGLRPEEIPWILTDRQYIPFHQSWADGLARLTKKLESVNTPRILVQGPLLVTQSLLTEAYVRNEPETLCTNCFVVGHVPDLIRRFRTSRPVSQDASQHPAAHWPHYRASDERLLAFDDPPPELTSLLGIAPIGTVGWREVSTVDHISSRDLVVSLIHASMAWRMASRGLIYAPDQRCWYVPKGLLLKNRLHYRRPDGHASWVRAVGARTYGIPPRKQTYRYHLSPWFSVLPGTSDPFVIVGRVRLYLTDSEGRPLQGRQVVSRRKHLCKDWWNEQWLIRLLGLAQLIATDDSTIRIGSRPDTQIVIEVLPIQLTSPVRLDDSRAEPPVAELTLREDDETPDVVPGREV